MKKLYKFEWDSYYAFIGGLFISTDEEINNNIGKNLNLGEANGKHSECYGSFEKEDITEVSDDQDFINKFELLIGKSFGHNPLDYIQENEE